jgi:hypothetical protein
MNITFACPECEQTSRLTVEQDALSLVCPRCTARIKLAAGAGAEERLDRCLVCPSRDIYLRKDFPQRLGVLFVGLGFVASSIAWAYSRPILTFAILFATALVDVVLYLLMPSVLMCYHCGAQYRHMPQMEGYGGFDLETHERYRQQKIRMAEHRPAAQAAPQAASARDDVRHPHLGRAE